MAEAEPTSLEQAWGWWSVFDEMDSVEASLEKEMLNPAKARLINHNQEYTGAELRAQLQYLGSCLSVLHATVAKTEAQGYALDESFKMGMKVAIKDVAGPTLAERESTVLTQNEVFRKTKKMGINHEALLILLKGWVKAYEAAYTAISRMLSMDLGEMGMQTSRLP